MKIFDVAVVGLGAMGSAAACHLARAGARVVAFDASRPPHTLGSSHGHTRIIREAYYEHPLYVPLVRRAYHLWKELERDAEVPLLRVTSGIMAGPEHGPVFHGARQSALLHGIEHEVLDADALHERFPMYAPEPGTVALVEKQAGILFAERCIDAHLQCARRHGAELRFDEPVTGWTSATGSVTLATAGGRLAAERVVVCAGPWLPELAERAGLKIPLEVERQLSHWFSPLDPLDDAFDASRCPVGLWEVPGGELFATLPDAGHGIKCGMHHAGGMTTPATVDRTVSAAESAAARALLARFAPRAAGPLRDARVCLYTNTPDRHFIIDWVERDRVLLLSPCSGHGFKFASAIGEVAMQMLAAGRAEVDVAPFSLARFA